MTYSFDGELWEWDGKAAWHFVSLPDEVSDEIEAKHGATAGGFGSVRVAVTIGDTSWSTSIFPDKKRATYLLPIKKLVRDRENLQAGVTARVELAVVT